MQETLVQSLIQEDPTCHGATKSMHHNHQACALESRSETAKELVCPGAPAPQQEESHRNEQPAHRNRRGAHAAAKTQHSQKQTHKIIFFKERNRRRRYDHGNKREKRGWGEIPWPQVKECGKPLEAGKARKSSKAREVC